MIVYHEQVMRTLATLAGYDLTYADHVRRHLDDEAMLPGFRADFIERAAARGVDRAAAERTWRAVAEFASFGFCKAHAAAFAVPTYRSSWLKTHYPAHFLAGILTHDPGMYPRRLLLDDARRHGVPILPLDVNRSEPEYVVEETDDGAFGIRLALQDVHGIADAEIRSILAGRADRPFTDVGDLLRRTTVARPVAEALAHAGAFDAPSADRPEPPWAPVRGDHRRGAPRGRPAHPGRRPGAGPRVRRLHRRRGRPGRARGPRPGRHPAPRELLRAAPGRPGGHAGPGPGHEAPGRVGDGRRGEDRHPDPGDPQRPADHLPVPGRRHRARRGHGLRGGPAEGREDGLPRLRDGVWGQLRRTGVKGVSVVAEEIWDLDGVASRAPRGTPARGPRGARRAERPAAPALARQPRFRGVRAMVAR